jgi:hyperosmotically inducible protein
VKILIRTGLMTALISGTLLGGHARASDNDADTTTKTTTTTTTTKKKHLKTEGHRQTAATTPDADNTATNKRDLKAGEPTADQQKNDKTDLELTAEIRRSVMADKDLSTNAHNIKIIAENGKVTLKGPVATAAERTTIEQKARQVAGKANVTSMIDVKP